MRRVLAVVVAASLAGCSGFATTSGRNTQLALTGLMALDTAQTVTIARSPCLFERNPAAAALFGSKRPSPETVLATNVIYMAGHWAFASYLDRKANTSVDFSIEAEQDVARKRKWRRLQRVYQWATALGHGLAVHNNVTKNIRPFSSFNCGGAQ